MPRRRMVDPGFWDDEKVGQLPRDVRLLYVALWSQADDAGLLEADPRRIKAFAFRYDERLKVSDVSRWLGLLEANHRVLRYQLRGRDYYCVRRFHRHQTIERPRKSDLPRPPREVLDELDEKCRKAVLQRTADPGAEAAKPAFPAMPIGEASVKHPRAIGEASPPMTHGVEERREELSREESKGEEKKSGGSLRSPGGHDGETELERLMRLHMEVSDPVVKATLERKIERIQAAQEATT